MATSKSERILDLENNRVRVHEGRFPMMLYSTKRDILRYFMEDRRLVRHRLRRMGYSWDEINDGYPQGYCMGEDREAEWDELDKLNTLIFDVQAIQYRQWTDEEKKGFRERDEEDDEE